MGLQFTIRSSFADMKVALIKELCPVHYSQGVSSCCNPCSPGQLDTSQWPLEHQDQPFFQLLQDAFSPIAIPEPALECAFICMSLQKQVFS